MNQTAPSTRKLMKLAQGAMQKHRAQEALGYLKEVISLNPQHAEALHNIGYILHSAGKYNDALDYYQRAIQADSNHTESYIMLCRVLETQNRGNEAMRLAHHATQVLPNDVKIHTEFVNQLMRFNQSHMVPAYLEQILPRFPKESSLWQHYAFALKVNDRSEEAEAAYRKLLAEHRVPAQFRFLYETYLPRLYRSTEEIDTVRNVFKQSLERFLIEKPQINTDLLTYQPLFQLAFHNRDNKELTQLYARVLRGMAPELNYVAPHCKAAAVQLQGKIKLGFVSRHMYTHSVGSCYRDVMIYLSQHPDFEVVFFNLANVMDDKIQQIIDAKVPIISLPRTVPSAQQVIASYKLDIIIYPDIGMDAMTHYLAMSRLAPHQGCFQGHPETTGIDTIDYVISSRSYEPPNAQENYCERLLCNPAVDTIFKRPTAPERWLSRSDIGLSEDKKLYVCPMAIQKFHPDFDGILAGILLRDPQAELVLFSDFQQQAMSNVLQHRILSKCDAARVKFMPWLSLDALFSVLKTADAILDTVYFGGGTTAQYSFGFGLPIVTMPGRYARGRVVHSYYSIMGITNPPEAATPEEYVELAVKLANDAAYKAALSDEILAKNYLMFEHGKYGPHLVQLLKDVIARDLDHYNR